MGKTSGRLALAGGRPLRLRPFSAWPAFDGRESAGLSRVLKSRNWGGYPFPNDEASMFAAAFARRHDAAFGVCAANGTVTLEVALKSCGVGPGDEVIVPAYTWEGTVAPVLFIGAVPVFVDVDPDTYCIDPARVAAAITGKTKAVIAVHLAMGMADMDALTKIAATRGLKLIEDCAHAHGARWKGRGAGSLGDAGSFSFQTSKLMTAGEGGALVTNDAELFELFQSHINCGRPSMSDKFGRRVLGYNYRMTEFQAALLRVQLARLDAQQRVRDRNAARLSRRLAALGLRPLKQDARVTAPAIYQYVFRYDPAAFGGVSRNAFVAALEAEGIPCEGLFYEPVYKSSLFSAAGRSFADVRCPASEKAAYEESVWLPHQLLLGTPRDVDDIADAVEKIRDHGGALAGLKHPKIDAKNLSRYDRARLDRAARKTQ